MKTKNGMFVLAILALIIASCKKENKANSYTIHGKVVQSCTDETPVAGLELSLGISYRERSNCNDIKFMTDENGNFSITYTDDDVCGTDVFINYYDDPRTAGIGLMYGFPPFPQYRDKGIKDFEVTLYKNTNITMNYKLKTTKTYTDKDTFYYSLKADPFLFWKKIAGPFVNDMVFDSILLKQTGYYQNQYEPHISPYYKNVKFSDHTKDTLIDIWAADPFFNICDTHTDVIFELP